MSSATTLSQEKASCYRSVCLVAVSILPKTKAYKKRLDEKLLAGQETKRRHMEERESMQQAGPSLKSIQVSREESTGLEALFEHAGDALDTDNESVDPSFNLDDSITSA